MAEQEVQNTKQDVSKPSSSSTRKFIYIVVVLLIIMVLEAIILLQSSQNSNKTSVVAYDNVKVPSALLAQLNVPNSISNQVGIGTAQYSQILYRINNKTELKLGGKPEILYVGAEYCPYCAAQRWAMLIALSRFGTFSNVSFMTSSASDYSPSSPTFTFYNSTYTSQYITFVSVEQTTNKLSGSNYAPLQQLTSAQLALAENYNPTGSIPFILIANRSFFAGATYDPLSVLGGKNWSVITQDLYNTSSLQSQSIIGSADLITEQICSADNNTPASVCSQPYVTNIRKVVGS